VLLPLLPAAARVEPPEQAEEPSLIAEDTPPKAPAKAAEPDEDPTAFEPRPLDLHRDKTEVMAVVVAPHGPLLAAARRQPGGRGTGHDPGPRHTPGGPGLPRAQGCGVAGVLAGRAPAGLRRLG